MSHMEMDKIRDRILRNLEEAGLVAENVRVQPDPYAGWRIAAVSPDFDGMSSEDRRRVALADLTAELKVQWLDLLTPEEVEWAGGLPAGIDPEELPLWPESLARANLGIGGAMFPSDLEEDLPPPIVATFYSLRGGVGRSTALAYTAWVLADKGKKVVCVDLDIEAPGLAALFGKESEVGDEQGVVDLLIALDQGQKPDVTKHLVRISDKDELYCLPAGVPDADYARKLSLIDPEAWYREESNPLRALIELLGSDLPFVPDAVLLDSRTGITRLSAPLLFDLADLAFVVFFPHPQARRGTEGLVRALLSSRTRRSAPERSLAPEPRFIVGPIPMPRVAEVGQRYKRTAEEWITSWLSDRERADGQEWMASEITHFIPYQEELAVSEKIVAERERWQMYVPLAEWIERFLPTDAEMQMAPVQGNRKSQVLEELDFSTATAEYQEHLVETFVETDVISRALRPAVPLVIGRKGAGKTAVFRYLMERQGVASFVILAPSSLRREMTWQITPNGFAAIAELLAREGKGWREFWTAYTCLACHVQWPQATTLMPGPLRESLGAPPQSELEIIAGLERILSMPKGPLLVDAWLEALDTAVGGDETRFLLFDGLDSGFGSTPEERERRTHAVSGLLSLVIDRSDMLKRLRFKIMLREDIWKGLRFENKSHLYGRSVKLTWDSQADYLTVVLRQALRAPSFRALVEDLLDRSDVEQIARPRARDAEAVYRVWNVLAGERMQGGKTAYTANWVWNRLGDANGDHSPRTLLQLFAKATELERDEHQRSAYDKSVIRPRALKSSLAEVSDQAVGALLDEEFTELQPLRSKLKELRRTPFQTHDVEVLADEVALALEVGLLSVYEGTESDPIRYHVPDIYRHGLGMTRPGQR